MLISKCILPFFVLCIVHGSLSKPISDNEFKGRGIGSTIWGWITYPFSWWSSDVAEILPDKDQLIVSTNPFNIEIAKRNVTVWCNDQTCTTMTCDKFGCVNITCSIYDTDLTGECRTYNTLVKPEEPTTTKFTDTASEPFPDKETDVSSKVPIIVSTTPSINNPVAIEDRPLELEAVLSSTVTEKEDKDLYASEQQIETNDQ